MVSVLSLILFSIVPFLFLFHNVENSDWCLRFENLQDDRYFQTTLLYWRLLKATLDTKASIFPPQL